MKKTTAISSLESIKSNAKKMLQVAPVMLIFNENLDSWWWTVIGMAYLAACVVATKINDRPLLPGIVKPRSRPRGG